ncbi:hypothetical protein WME75_11385 [Sorangium sp. So ce1014]|uniref:helix-turn-helix domain-containing protein n=1 Tax=Sorangium sp. So ce1014 TaxID=3133326 RepID=UPI003F6340E0
MLTEDDSCDFDLRSRFELEAQVPRELLVQPWGNVAAVARELGRERAQVHRWLRRYNTNIDELR